LSEIHNIMTIENCLTISITDLKEKGFLKKRKTVAVLNLTNNNDLCLSVDVEIILNETEKYLILTHTSETEINKTVRYKVSLVSIHSNLGGFIMYFVCPITGKHCRKLYYSGKTFQHRDATGLLYAQQAKKQPISYANYLSEEQRNEPNTKYFKKYYKGNYTKRYFRIVIKTSHSEVIDAYKEMLNRRNNYQRL
jgi:hypothetical protein